jgi:serine/threonine protein kinase
MALTSGAKLGPYEILSLLGAGGMGEVYRAVDIRLSRTVAIKVLASHLSNSPELKQRMEREARAISSLNHPQYLPALRHWLARRSRLSGHGVSGGRNTGRPPPQSPAIDGRYLQDCALQLRKHLLLRIVRALFTATSSPVTSC